ncbi:MAG: histone, partial [Nitrosospira sp.]|nr:histone [Nitrosospira sp.]
KPAAKKAAAKKPAAKKAVAKATNTPAIVSSSASSWPFPISGSRP